MHRWTTRATVPAVSLAVTVSLLLGLTIWIPLAAGEYHGNAIVGNWVVAENDACIEIYREGDMYSGKISWLRDPQEKPAREMYESPRVGLIIVRDFRFDGQVWKDGRLYDPSDGKSYKGVIALGRGDTLRVRGFVGIEALGRTTVWHRARYRECPA